MSLIWTDTPATEPKLTWTQTSEGNWDLWLNGTRLVATIASVRNVRGLWYFTLNGETSRFYRTLEEAKVAAVAELERVDQETQPLQLNAPLLAAVIGSWAVAVIIVLTLWGMIWLAAQAFD